MELCPAARIAARLDLVARRSDGNREFARLLELCLTHSMEAVEAALAQAREQGGWSADTVRHLLNFASAQDAAPPPLDPSKSPAYQRLTPPPDLTRYNRLLEDFDFSLIPCVSKVRLLELAQGAFLSSHDNVLFIGPSGIGKTQLLMGLGRALCLAGYRVLFRSAVTLATELEVAHKELRLPRRLSHYRRFDLILVDELGYLPFAKQTSELLFQFFSDRYERASIALTSNLAFAQWTQVFGNEQMTAALLDRLVHRSHILMMEGESFRFRQSLQKQDPSS